MEGVDITVTLSDGTVLQIPGDAPPPDGSEKSDKSDKSSKSDKSDKSDKSGKSGKD